MWTTSVTRHGGLKLGLINLPPIAMLPHLHSDFNRFKRAATPPQPGTSAGFPVLPPAKPKRQNHCAGYWCCDMEALADCDRLDSMD